MFISRSSSYGPAKQLFSEIEGKINFKIYQQNWELAPVPGKLQWWGKGVGSVGSWVNSTASLSSWQYSAWVQEAGGRVRADWWMVNPQPSTICNKNNTSAPQCWPCTFFPWSPTHKQMICRQDSETLLLNWTQNDCYNNVKPLSEINT